MQATSSIQRQKEEGGCALNLQHCCQSSYFKLRKEVMCGGNLDVQALEEYMCVGDMRG